MKTELYLLNSRITLSCLPLSVGEASTVRGTKEVRLKNNSCIYPASQHGGVHVLTGHTSVI